MAVNLSSELHRFCTNANRLRQIFEETKKCFDDINASGNFDGTQIIQAILLQEEEAEITHTVERPPAVVVFGQTPYAKARIVNELFGKKFLPPLENEDIDTRFRMVRFKHGITPTVSLTLPDDYDLVDALEADNGPWHTIPRKDLVISDEHTGPGGDSARGIAHLEVTQNHPLLRFGTHVVVAPAMPEGLTEEVVKQCVEQIPSILVYGFSSDHLHDKDIQDLGEIGKVTSFQPICFVRVPPPGSSTVDTDPPDGGSDPKTSGHSDGHTLRSPIHSHSQHAEACGSGMSSPSQLDNSVQPHAHAATESANSTGGNMHKGTSASCAVSSDLRNLLCRLGYLPGIEGKYRRALAQDYYTVESIFVERFNEFLPMFTQFARQICQACLVNAATVLNNSHTRCLRMFILSAFDMARDMLITPKKLEFVREKEEELYKSLLAISVSKITEIRDMISETIVDISESVKEECAAFDLSPYGIGKEQKATSRVVKQCAERIQELVLMQLNASVAGKLVSSVNILRDSYTGTLTRCLKSLEEQTSDNPEEVKTTVALKQILNTAYEVEITVRSSSSLIKSLLEKMKQLVQSMPWKSPPVVDSEWKRKVAAEMLSGLSEARLAKSIASQIKDRLNRSHEMFGVSLRQLEVRHTGRLDRIEEQRLKLRKVHAPRLAKLALESTSLRDTILYGMPQMGREIGRGQYGVVYSCDSWATYTPVAIKSVVPPDDKHWNDLALEFFYTKNIPEHKRIVVLRGSVIDYMYGGGMSPAVLLVMDRLQKDLYTAIKQGLEWHHRLQVAIDVVEGLRYLHSQGLVHRDVKLKNVLLDKDCRGKITDLGFCKPEAMMSGSIVGTPIHMAPELFTGQYDNSVDVYAFGILFWYVCAGHVHLPSAFEQCANKDQLWQYVKKGLRPERLQAFSEACWDLMQRCWVGEPKDRPFFGDVQLQLQQILDKVRRRSVEPGTSSPNSKDKVHQSRHIRARSNHHK